MNFHFFFFALNTQTGKAACFATKHLPIAHTRGARFSYWEINGATEIIPGTKKTVSWDYGKTGQDNQLRAALGPDWQVFDLLQTLQKIEQ